jgi:hypothetical protein
MKAKKIISRGRKGLPVGAGYIDPRTHDYDLEIPPKISPSPKSLIFGIKLSDVMVRTFKIWVPFCRERIFWLMEHDKRYGV